MPFGLGGQLVLLNASCKRCAKVTSSLETTLLKHQWFAARAALRTRTRRPKVRRKSRPMLIENDGEIHTVLAGWQDQWKVIQLPIFPAPAHLDGRPYAGGIESTSMDQFELSEKGEDIAKRHGADKVLLPDYPVEVFARFVAKVAYGYAVAEPVFLVHAQIIATTAEIVVVAAIQRSTKRIFFCAVAFHPSLNNFPG